MLIVYPAVFHKEDGAYWAEVLDLKGCNTFGGTLEETLESAKEALEGYCLTVLEGGGSLPKPTEAISIQLKEENAFVSLASCELKHLSRQAVKKTLTIPQWLNDAAIKENINFSKVLQEALMVKLNLK